MMNAPRPGQHTQDPPNGNVSESSRPSFPQQHGSNGGNGGPFPPRGPMSRAERFEDEKKRIIESCFSKRDTDGSGQFS